MYKMDNTKCLLQHVRNVSSCSTIIFKKKLDQFLCNLDCCCCCCCEIPDHRVVPTVETSLVSYSHTLHVVSVLYGDFNMCFL